jgi:hypothetical protein
MLKVKHDRGYSVPAETADLNTESELRRIGTPTMSNVGLKSELNRKKL